LSPNSRKNCRHRQNQTCRVLFTSYNVSNTPRPTVLQEAHLNIFWREALESWIAFAERLGRRFDPRPLSEAGRVLVRIPLN
jgi:hypothetical protein